MCHREGWRSKVFDSLGCWMGESTSHPLITLCQAWLDCLHLCGNGWLTHLGRSSNSESACMYQRAMVQRSCLINYTNTSLCLYFSLRLFLCLPPSHPLSLCVHIYIILSLALPPPFHLSLTKRPQVDAMVEPFRPFHEGWPVQPPRTR